MQTKKLVAALAILLLTVVPASAQDSVPDELLVKFRDAVPSTRAPAVFHAHRATIIETLAHLRIHRIRVASAALEAVERALAADPDVEFVERNRRFPPAFVPNDPSYPSEYHLPIISAPQSWDLSRGANVTIAILDSGVDPTHPDLASKLVPGINLYSGDTNTTDIHGHGTAVAGTAAAIGNNSSGVAGVALQSSIMPIRVSDATGTAYTSTLANGVTYAADHGARVINMSFSGVAASSSITSAANYARSKGAVVVAAAGNCGCFDSTPPNSAMISVSATDSSDNLAGFTSRGSYIDIAAPGVSIVTTMNGGGYGIASGTSFSSPIVAGVVALIIARNPALTPASLESLLRDSADDRGPAGYDTGYGHGRVNAYRAVLGSGGASPPPSTGTSPTIGWLDGISASGNAHGWALDPDTSGTAIAVQFYVDGSYAGTVTANQPRPDLNQILGVSGDHGFTFAIPGQYRDGLTHTLAAYGIDATGNPNALLTGAPKTFTLGALAVPIGWLDSISAAGTAYGWALDPDTSGTTIAVQFYVDGSYAGTVTANQPRPDLNQGLGVSGDHGFTFAIPGQYRDGLTHTLAAYGIDATGNPNALLAGAPKAFTLAP